MRIVVAIFSLFLFSGQAIAQVAKSYSVTDGYVLTNWGQLPMVGYTWHCAERTVPTAWPTIAL